MKFDILSLVTVASGAMSRRSWPTLVMLLVAVMAIAGHVCVLPHAHAADFQFYVHEADLPTEAASSQHDHPGTDEAAHAASCSGLRASQVSVVAPALRSELASAAVDRRGAADAAVIAPMFTAPPLFLLHASLLI